MEITPSIPIVRLILENYQSPSQSLRNEFAAKIPGSGHKNSTDGTEQPSLNVNKTADPTIRNCQLHARIPEDEMVRSICID